MKFIKYFNESLDDSDDFQNSKNKYYYVQRGPGAEELLNIKRSILNNMSPSMQDVWLDLDDYILELKDKYGKYINKYDTQRDIIDFDSLSLEVKLGKEIYSIATEDNTEYLGGKTFIAKRNEKNQKIYAHSGVYRKEGDLVNTLSTYSSDFDQKFYDFYKRKGGKIDLFYSFLIGPDYEYVDLIKDDKEKYKEILNDIKSTVKKAMRKLNATIIYVEEIDTTSANKWMDVSSLDNITGLRLNISFKVN